MKTPEEMNAKAENLLAELQTQHMPYVDPLSVLRGLLAFTKKAHRCYNVPATGCETCKLIIQAEDLS